MCLESGCNASIWVVPQKLNFKLLSLSRGQKLFLYVLFSIKKKEVERCFQSTKKQNSMKMNTI